jgi:Fe-S-cluster containining protein
VVSVAAAVAIPLKVLPLGEQRYSCHGCGDCCRDFTVQLRERDLARLREQGWERELGDVTVEFRGRRYLRQRADGACVFLQPDGRCRIHAEHGFEAKPVACQLFPFTLAPDARAARVGVSFACASVLASKGASLASHLAEVRRMAGEVDELAPARTMLDARTEATPEEADAVADAVERWMAGGGVPLPVRVDGLAWLAQQLARAPRTLSNRARAAPRAALHAGRRDSRRAPAVPGRAADAPAARRASAGGLLPARGPEDR